MQKQGKHFVTLKDIAEVVGYSINTVSRALRDKEDISEDTRRKIQQTAFEMGYINNAVASSLRLGYTSTIAVILGDISNPHFAIMMKEIEERARHLGYTSFLLSSEEDESLERKAIQSALNKNVDGIILCPTQKSTANIEFLKKTGVPYVLLGRSFEGLHEDCVLCNDELGGYQATKHLLEQGHRDIVMFNGDTHISSARNRLAGYCRALEESGIPVRQELILEVAVTGGGCARALRSLEERGISYTAIFAFSDLLAWEAWSCLREAGKRVPEDCSIIGFDFIQSRLPLPYRLTSVSSHKLRMSVAAVDLLAERMHGKAGEPKMIVIDTELAEGETVSPASEV